jgi:hypothetical protein
MEAHCDNCKWWHRYDPVYHGSFPGEEYGECHRNAPVKLESGRSVGQFPASHEKTDCGEWLSKDDPYPWEGGELKVDTPNTCEHCNHWNSEEGGEPYCDILDRMIDRTVETPATFGCNKWTA